MLKHVLCLACVLLLVCDAAPKNTSRLPTGSMQAPDCHVLLDVLKFWDSRQLSSWNTSAGDDEKEPSRKTQTESSSKTPENWEEGRWKNMEEAWTREKERERDVDDWNKPPSSSPTMTGITGMQD